MKRMIVQALAAFLSLALVACSGAPTVPPAATDTTWVEESTKAPDAQLPVGEEDKMESVKLDIFRNPLITPTTSGAWQDYGVGDPFVMRWNGVYYLYCSTKDGCTGIQVWSSLDLVDWTYRGLCCDDARTVGAYAPEVTYYNGAFYMVTSPGGNGHYTLRSTSPLGPFAVVTENYGHSIDGHIFIDNDGKWYFYTAGMNGIVAYEMSSPYQVAEKGSTVGAYMNDWTEGPMLIYYNGVYYLTYAGNHVWSKGYRIDYATSTEGPLHFTAAANNPMLVCTDFSCYGIGHSSTVVGPDLDSYYIVYHTTAGAVPQRDMRIDRLVLNGEHMEVLGPTVSRQQKPALPEAYSYFVAGSDTAAFELGTARLTEQGLALSAGDRVLSKSSFGERFTVEANFCSVASRAGVLFGYQDERNYGKAVFDAESGQLFVTFVVDGVTAELQRELVKSFGEAYDFNALQTLTVRRSGNTFTFLVNGRELMRAESALGAGRIGVISEAGAAVIGFTGISRAADQSAVKESYKPVEGRLEATTCTETVKTVAKSDTPAAEQAVVAAAGNSFTYLVNVGKTGQYDIRFQYASATATEVAVYQNNKYLVTVTLPATNGEWRSYLVRGVRLEQNVGSLRFAYASGTAMVVYYELIAASEVATLQYDYTNGRGLPSYFDGIWRAENGALCLKSTDGQGYHGKLFYGRQDWSNYTVSVDVTPEEGRIDCGLAVRVTDPATAEDNLLIKGAAYYRGYYIGIVREGISLQRCDYAFREVARFDWEMTRGTTYHLTVEAVDDTIRVWLDGELVITYTDPEPLTHGMAGVHGYNCKVKFDRFLLEPATGD